jgi:hypothetical protein
VRKALVLGGLRLLERDGHKVALVAEDLNGRSVRRR